MNLSMIVAHDINNGIGYKNTIPWHIPTDFKWFKEKTNNNIVVMGSNTYFSLPEKFRPLPNRENYVLCDNSGISNDIIKEGATVFSTIDELLSYCKDKDKEIFIIGGASIYNQFIDKVNKLYITKIKNVFNCDTYFPKYDINEWEEIYKSKLFIENNFEYNFNIYIKK